MIFGELQVNTIKENHQVGRLSYVGDYFQEVENVKAKTYENVTRLMNLSKNDYETFYLFNNCGDEKLI